MRKLLYGLVIKSFFPLNRLGLFHSLWEQIVQPRFDVQTQLFGTNVWLPSTYRYPVTSRVFPTYNNPLVQLAYCCHRQTGRKLVIADIGAAIGDTFLLLVRNLPDVIQTAYCIEPFQEFSRFLHMNMSGYKEVRIFEVLLSDKTEQVKSLLKVHESTASAQGDTFTTAVTLDEVLTNKQPVTLLKIDVDGFDGKVLGGAKLILASQKPYVIFEFHPILIQQTGNSFLQPFNVLFNCSYQELIWFDKTGSFSHFSSSNDHHEIQIQVANCLSHPAEDRHYDIIALPPGHTLNKQELADCSFAKTKRYSY